MLRAIVRVLHADRKDGFPPAERVGWGSAIGQVRPPVVTFESAPDRPLKFQELIGRVVLNKDGSTGWQDGPAIQAAKAGGILLLDEMNFLRPSVVGGLNALLDAGRYVIPETGEDVPIHPDFRIAATANAVSGDQGHVP